MEFESLRCRPFGPFQDSTFGFAPGMNVIHGPNESGKSTLRAALSVGLCGQRRGRRPTKVAEEFTRRHQPWDDPTAWAVSVVIRMAEGQRVELSQDLAYGVDSSAREVDSHRDLSNQIMKDRAPDGSQWLGLSRATFESVACVRQAEILAILNDADDLQKDLQRAAATARARGTARAAVDLLSEFRREQVGTARAPTKPLRRTQDAVRAAEEASRMGRERHEAHRSKRSEIRLMEDAERELWARRRTMEAILAEAEAESARERYRDALESSRRFPHGPPVSPDHEKEEGLEESLARALDNWGSAPNPRPPTGPTAEELRERIAESEKREAACRAVGLEIELADLEGRYERAAALQAQFPDGAPRAPDGAQGDLDRRVAVALEAWRSAPEPAPLGGESSERIAARIEASWKEERGRAAVRAEVEARGRRSILDEARRLAERLRSAPERRPDERESIEREVVEALRRWDERPDSDPPSGQTEAEIAAEQAAVDDEAMGLEERPGAADVLRQRPLFYGIGLLFTIALLTFSGVTGSIAGWVASAVLAAGGIHRFHKALRRRTAERRRRREELAAHRRRLERAMTARQMEDQAYEQDRRKIERAERAIRSAAAHLDSTATNLAASVEFLQEWLGTRRRDREAFDAFREIRARLEQMTDGRDVADLEAECDALDRKAREAAADSDTGLLESVRRAPLSDADWERFQRTAAQERERWSAECAEREAAEAAHEERVEGWRAAADDLVKVAGLARVDADSPEAAAAELEKWQSRRTERQKEFDRRNRDWGTLRGLLEQRTLEEFEQEVEERRRELGGVSTETSEERVVAVRAQATTPEARERLQGRERSRRKAWGDALLSRETQDRTYAGEVSRRDDLAWAVIAAAKTAGEETTDPASAAETVREWLSERQRQQDEYENRLEEWGRYQEKMEGVTLEDLEGRAVQLARDAERLSAGRDETLYEDLRSTGSVEIARQRDACGGELDRLRRKLDQARGESRQVEKTLPPLVELEETLERAKAERDRFLALSATIETTIRFLKQAEERIHRDLALVLRRGVRRRLAGITGGRYTDCRVDPETLGVKVCGDEERWRSAADLSRGTAEQIYLLLRVTLAEHLGKEGEPCPLILDDPTASSDAERRDAVLEALLAIAAERQVVLFTHDQGVRDWAERHVAGDSRHRIQQLSTEAIRP